MSCSASHLFKQQSTTSITTMEPDKLYFYSKSRDVPPGKGTNEHVSDHATYAGLARVRGWRQILSNFSVTCPVRWHGLSFQTIEHAFQYTKIALVDPIAAGSFAIESGSALALGTGADAQKARKLRKLDAMTLRQWDAMSGHVMREIAASKLRDCPIYRHVLVSTKNAQLWHVRMRQSAERWVWLERLRSDL